MDFLIKNTKGLTLKTKGKYCTEDLVIEIDPSLVEGYMEIDELPEVGLPRVLYKLMLEEPEYYIWENDEWVKISGSDPNLQEKTVTPSNSSQTITPDTDYDGLSKVNVEAIPDEYIIPNLQEKEITENGEYVADEGYDGFSKVTVNVASSGGGGLIEVSELPEVGEEDVVYHLYNTSAIIDMYFYEMLLSSMSGACSFEIVNTLPTENINVSGANGFYIYFLTTDNRPYVYGDLMGSGKISWSDLLVAFLGSEEAGLACSYQGTIESIEEATNPSGFYLISGVIDKLYLYKDGKYTELFDSDPKKLIDGSITEIDSDITNPRRYAFAGCESLISVKMPKVSVIPTSLCYGCSSLTNVEFPNAIEIGTAAFKQCEALISAKFPKVSMIYGWAFMYSTSLKDLYLGYEGVVSLESDNIFMDGTTSCNVHVRAEYANQYSAAAYWKKLIEAGTITIVADYSD